MRMNQMKEVGIELKKVQEPSMLHMNLEKHPMHPSQLKLGKMIKAMVHAKVTSVHQDKFGKHASLEIHKFDHQDTNKEGDPT